MWRRKKTLKSYNISILTAFIIYVDK
jgi:hypothetical protein